MPASPVSSTNWARPATEARNRSTSCRRSAARPTSAAGAATAATLRRRCSRGSSAAYAARVAARRAHAELALPHGGALVVDAERAGRVAARGVQAHEPAVAVLAQRVGAQQPFGVRDGLRELARRPRNGRPARPARRANARAAGAVRAPARVRRARPAGRRRRARPHRRQVGRSAAARRPRRRSRPASARCAGLISRWSSTSGSARRRVCSSLRRFVCAWASVESGQSAAASRLRGWASGCSTRYANEQLGAGRVEPHRLRRRSTARTARAGGPSPWIARAQSRGPPRRRTRYFGGKR